MDKREAKFWQKLKKFFLIEFLERVENEVGVGWPDVHGVQDGFPFWIELKAEKKFPNKIKYQPGQPNWLTRYWEVGGFCYTFLYVEDQNKLYIWIGKHARELNKKGGTRDVKPMLEIICNEKGWLELLEMFCWAAHKNNHALSDVL